MRFLLVCLLIFEYSGLVLPAQEEISEKSIVYLIKYAWHTGLLIEPDSSATARIEALKVFEEFSYVDIGWGDEDFYQSDDVDYFLAIKAALWPTSSVLKLTGHKSELQSILRWCEYAFEIELDQANYIRMLEFINYSFQYNGLQPVTASIQAEGAIRYYKSVHTYSLAYTCNSWVADALCNAGISIDPDEIITSEQLYKSLITFGKVLK